MSEWNPSDYDPDEEARQERVEEGRRQLALGVDRDTVNAWIRAIWIDFETKLNDHCRRRYAETGLNPSDADKATWRRSLHAQLKSEFGRSLPDKDWTDAVEARLAGKGSRAA